ncbi:cytochrome P450 750A1-like [Cryptomeria japonica]|nr:cytochrome P450 750A1-like [Cryptomeria japonica]XP_059071499.1 cytochrome P450 750A1-like [Cryptomeria japonica]
MAKEFLKTHDKFIANRPLTAVGKYIGYNFKDLILSLYGPYWRHMRKLCVVELLNTKRIDSFRCTQEEEMLLAIHSVWEMSRQGEKLVNLTNLFSSFMQAVMWRVLFDTKIFSHSHAKVGGNGLDGFARRVAAAEKVHNLIAQAIQILHDIFLAGVETTSATIEWAMSEILRNPGVAKKMQEEIESVVGRERTVCERDIGSLEYMQCVVKETLRLYPVLPLIFPHESTKDCTVGGYFIWAIGRDPSLWEDPRNSSQRDLWTKMNL